MTLLLQYHGGTIFGKAANYPDSLATTVLAIMIKCLFGGPAFLVKMIPVFKLDSKFLYEQVTQIIRLIVSSGGHVTSVIADNNRTNQAFFKLFATAKDKPWLTEDSFFLLFDYVHLFKTRYWLTEKLSELEFFIDGEKLVARWTDLIDLFNFEKDDLTKLSSLTEVAVYPKPIERQRVSTCLKVFCDRTLSALKSHTCIKQSDVRGTILFIEKILSFWKIASNKEKYGDERHRDPLKKPIETGNYSNILFLEDMANMATQMRGQQGKRIKSLTRDTSIAVYHTCKGLIERSKKLVEMDNEYVLLGDVTTDDLENKFGSLRQDSGGIYFITVQNILEKHDIEKTILDTTA